MLSNEIEAIENILLSYGKHIDVLEWGSGGSTVYFTRFLRESGISYSWTSMEYNKQWYEKITEAVKEDPDTKLYLFDVGNTELKQRFTNMDEYVTYPASLGKKYDVIIVDGRKRRRCLLEVAKLLKPNGTAILHDARRTYYHSAFKMYPDSRIVARSGLWFGRLESPGIIQKILNLLNYWGFRVYTFSFRFRSVR
jgi:hypothetical protein